MKVNASKLYRGKCLKPYFLANIEYFWQCFTGMYVKMSTCDSQSKRILGYVLGQLGGSQWNSYERGLLWIASRYRVETW